MCNRVKGRVKWFKESKGLGLIEEEWGGEVFGDLREMSGWGLKSLVEGEKVCFRVGEGEKGGRGVNMVAV